MAPEQEPNEVTKLHSLKTKHLSPCMETDADLTNIVNSSIGTKFASKWGQLIVDLAVKAVRTVYRKDGESIEIDTKRYAKVEKIPGGSLEDSCVLDGVMFNKDVTHPGMRREIRNPRVVLLDCPLEYKKGESMTNMEFTQETDFKAGIDSPLRWFDAQFDITP